MKFLFISILSFLLGCSTNHELKKNDKNFKDKLNNLDINQNKIIIKID